MIVPMEGRKFIMVIKILFFSTVVQDIRVSFWERDLVT